MGIDYMKESTEKRKSERHGCSPPLTYQLSLFDTPFNAKGADYSDDGIAFKSDDSVAPGTIIFVKHRDCRQCGLNNESCKGCRTATFAMVKWCREFYQIDSHYFKVGAKYLVPNDASFF